MQTFLKLWGEAAYTSAGFFWMALWAFILGYFISSLVQVFVTRKRMQRFMGDAGAGSMFLGTFFGFISSSCSFSALASTKSLFRKGASFSSSIAYLLASTNLVIELGIVISIFLGWQFVVGEYVGGILLIAFSWLIIKITKPWKLVKQARNKLGEAQENDEKQDLRLLEKLWSVKSWKKVGKQYGMEWKMVWKDVTIGFTIAGLVAVFVPDSFFATLFINSGAESESYGFFSLLEHVIAGPVAAFLTFIGSMGNIPLAALLYSKGVSFAGVMAFIFSDLVVFPVLRINARYYGWKMSMFILFLLFTSLIITALLLHYSFDLLNILPSGPPNDIVKQEFFKVNYSFYLNIGFLIVSAILVFLGFVKGKEVEHHIEMASKSALLENILKWLALLCYLWLAIGLILKFTMV